MVQKFDCMILFRFYRNSLNSKKFLHKSNPIERVIWNLFRKIA
ncbi:hypothetical protein G436_1538 [Leptospira interrogans serovar Hardjo str. Norma]|uniref:Uncharacterized protein n=1 Tax=Leptospira interrogans serovar Hardjo str. Norma TaxID=1279460 RepID=A0A0M4MSW2_LEPIR|nr:hypothetical protein G436_1538 [Leptospira interrogans serovar Hardjo str. Norma]